MNLKITPGSRIVNFTYGSGGVIPQNVLHQYTQRYRLGLANFFEAAMGNDESIGWGLGKMFRAHGFAESDSETWKARVSIGSGSTQSGLVTTGYEGYGSDSGYMGEGTISSANDPYRFGHQFKSIDNTGASYFPMDNPKGQTNLAEADMSMYRFVTFADLPTESSRTGNMLKRQIAGVWSGSFGGGGDDYKLYQTLKDGFKAHFQATYRNNPEVMRQVFQMYYQHNIKQGGKYGTASKPSQLGRPFGSYGPNMPLAMYDAYIQVTREFGINPKDDRIMKDILKEYDEQYNIEQRIINTSYTGKK